MDPHEINKNILEIWKQLERNTSILEQNTEHLREHIRRTNLLEGQMETALLPIRVFRILVYTLGIASTILAVVSATLHIF